MANAQVDGTNQQRFGVHRNCFWWKFEIHFISDGGLFWAQFYKWFSTYIYVTDYFYRILIG